MEMILNKVLKLTKCIVIWIDDFVSRVFFLHENDFKELIGVPKSQVYKFIEIIALKYKEGEQRGRPTKLNLHGEIMLFLLHFRHYPGDILLGVIFGIDKQTANNIHHRILNDFYELLRPTISLKTYQWRLEHSSEYLHTKYSFIVDGSEQGVMRSKMPLTDSRFYSAKKKRHSINILLVVSAVGKKILYLSSSFPGSSNDPKIVNETKEQWLKLLQPEEYDIGDSIFKFDDDSIHIHPPHDEHCDSYPEWCKLCVPVENMIECVKNFGACKNELRISVTGNKDEILIVHHKYWTIYK